jgi:molecular chaperone DnaJ
VLGVRPGVTVEQVKAAYRRQALRYHPDKNPGSEEAAERFKLCNDAYSVLSDPQQRAAYDDRRLGWGVQEVVGSLVDELLGNRRRPKINGRDVRFNLELTFREAALGVSRPVKFTVAVPCGGCGGRGAAPGGIKPCPECHGKGERGGRAGLLARGRPCPHCGGQGISIVEACAECGGVGSQERLREFSVKLPAGVSDGDVKIIERQGEPGEGGGRAGDLHVIVRVRGDSLFLRNGSDVVLELPLSLSLAALGGVVEVPTLGGSVRMKVPAGTQTGRTFRLKGKGIPRGKGRGDQLVRVVVETPVELSDEQRRLLEQFEVSCGRAAYPLQDKFRSRAERREGAG